MKRSTQKEGIRWQKLGGGSFTLRDSETGKKRIIKPGEKFTAKLEDIPETFRDLLVPLGDIPTESDTPAEVSQPVYDVVHKGGGRYVVEKDGKVINEAYLSKEEANELIKELS